MSNTDPRSDRLVPIALDWETGTVSMPGVVVLGPELPRSLVAGSAAWRPARHLRSDRHFVRKRTVPSHAGDLVLGVEFDGDALVGVDFTVDRPGAGWADWSEDWVAGDAARLRLVADAMAPGWVHRRPAWGRVNVCEDRRSGFASLTITYRKREEKA